MKLTFAIFLVSSMAAATTLQSVEVTGEKEAQVVFHLGSEARSIPGLRIHDNLIDLTFNETDLAENLHEKLELNSPHALLHRVSVFRPETGIVRARLVMNGTIEGLKERTQIEKHANDIKLTVAFPKGQGAPLKLLSEEEEPLASLFSAQKAKQPHVATYQILVVVLFLILSAGICYFVLRFLQAKKRGPVTRKYLIEQVSYCPLGKNTGVSLLKIGQEFVLVGITANQINILSSLPKLSDQYEEESQFDRRNFKEAMSEELERLKSKSRLEA